MVIQHFFLIILLSDLFNYSRLIEEFELKINDSYSYLRFICQV